PTPPTPVADPAAVAGEIPGTLAADLAGVAGVAGGRALLRRDAVLLGDLPGHRSRRHRGGALLALVDGGVVEGVAAAHAAALPRRAPGAGPRPRPPGRAQGLVSVPRLERLHPPGRLPLGQPVPGLRRSQVPCAGIAQHGP